MTQLAILPLKIYAALVVANTSLCAINCTNGVFAEPICDKRKQIGELKLESQRSRLNVLLKHIQFIANSEGVDEKEIASLALQLISNVEHDRKVSQVCSVILDTGTFAHPQKELSIDKSAFLLDCLEIGKRKYKNLRKLCKSEGIIFPSYDKIALFRTEISLSTGIELVQSDGQTIGAGYSYKEIVQHTTERILQTITIHPTQYPLEIEIADGLDQWFPNFIKKWTFGPLCNLETFLWSPPPEIFQQASNLINTIINY